MSPFLPQLLLIGLAGIQGALLLIRKPRSESRFWENLLSFSGLVAAFGLGVGILFVDEATAFGGMLRTPAAMRSVWAAIALASIMAQRAVAGTKQLPLNRKPEVYLILTLLLLLSATLLQAEGYLMLFLCAYAMGWLALALTGVTSSGREVSEALLKYWYQLSVAGVVGLLALLFISVMGPSFQLSAVATSLSGLGLARAMPLALAVLLPLYLIVGAFPFHFVVIDRDHGSPWAVQMINVLLVTAPGIAAATKVMVVLLGGQTEVSGVLPFLAFGGFLGAFWSLFGAITQTNTKRLLAYVSAGIWSGSFGVLGVASSLTVAASLYLLVVCVPLLAVLFWSLGYFHERLQSNELKSICGLGRHRLDWGLFLMVGFGTLLMAPPFPGFSLLVNILGASLGTGWVILLCMAALFLVLGGIGFFLLSQLYFKPSLVPLQKLAHDAPIHQLWLDRLVQGTVFAIAVAGGVFWNKLWEQLLPAAEALIRLY